MVDKKNVMSNFCISKKKSIEEKDKMGLLGKIKSKFGKKEEYVSWDHYKQRIDFIDDYEWQQSVRKRNLGGLE